MPIPTMQVADAVRAVARELITEHHPHLLAANILYVFTDQRRKRCDRVRLGSAAKMNALQRFLASGFDGVEEGPNFIILIDSVLWAELTRDQRAALVDHELCHCAVFVNGIDDAGFKGWRRWTNELKPIDQWDDWRFGMRGHDIEEFGEVLFRHGFWKPDAPEKKFGEIVALQTRIPA
jgi:hypothetical protein